MEPGTVLLNDLIEGLYFAGGGPLGEASAFISRLDGQLYLVSDQIDEELPVDIDDESIYVQIPDKNELGLGRDLVFQFIAERLPDSSQTVHGYFARRGAYGKFKDLLLKKSMLATWHTYEQKAYEVALLAWGREQGFTVLHDGAD